MDPECDRRNVMFNVINRKGEHLATLNHCLDADGFRDIGERQTFLDPLNKQSPYSKALLKLFRTKVMDMVMGGGDTSPAAQDVLFY